MEIPHVRRPGTYVNPVYDRSFPDPFVLKFRDEYYAYCTGFGSDGRVFPILRSTDLVNWSPVGTAMAPLDTSPPFYWAPEVTAADGSFYLYYSVGNEDLMEIRVAVSNRPDGGFVDAGKRLTFNDFAIDPHVFIDGEGQKYLFYATDFLDHSHIGTGTVIDIMTDWFSLAGDPRAVTRARYDWQVYDPKRDNKGGVRWHTVEGPFVMSRKGVYFEMFSGGNWQNTTYGVSFAATGDLDQTDEWTQYSDGEKVFPILRTISGKIIGPGHNCVVRGPNNRELFCVYHRWTNNGRVLAIDRLDFAGDRIFILGATDTSQPAPFEPSIAGFDERWQRPSKTEWRRDVPRGFVCEFTSHGDRSSLRLATNASEITVAIPLGQSLVRIDSDGRWAKVIFDGWHVAYEGWLESDVSGLVLTASDVETEISAFTLTEGFEDLCDRGPETLANGEWITDESGSLTASDGEMIFSSSVDETILSRDQHFTLLDFAANIRSTGPTSANDFGLLLVESGGREAVRLTIGAKVSLEVDRERRIMSLPEGWLIAEMRQYRLLVHDGRLIVYLENIVLSESPFVARHVSPAIFSSGGAIVIEMVRATAI